MYHNLSDTVPQVHTVSHPGIPQTTLLSPRKPQISFSCLLYLSPLTAVSEAIIISLNDSDENTLWFGIEIQSCKFLAWWSYHYTVVSELTLKLRRHEVKDLIIDALGRLWRMKFLAVTQENSRIFTKNRSRPLPQQSHFIVSLQYTPLKPRHSAPLRFTVLQSPTAVTSSFKNSSALPVKNNGNI